MRKLIKKLLLNIFKEEFADINKNILMSANILSEIQADRKKLNSIINQMDISVDVHESPYSSSWAVISIQGGSKDFVKFIDLKYADIVEIKAFLSRYDKSKNIKIDASPNSTRFLKI